MPLNFSSLFPVVRPKVKVQEYVSVHGSSFDPWDEGELVRKNVSYYECDSNTAWIVTSISLPEGATITAAIVYGNVVRGSTRWDLKRTNLTSAIATDIASSFVNCGDNTIHQSNADVDNRKSTYMFVVSSLSLNDQIYGATIAYTIWR